MLKSCMGKLLVRATWALRLPVRRIEWMLRSRLMNDNVSG